MSHPRNIKRVCLAYSGGLDTSVILHWLIHTYDCEVVAYTADVGQEEELTGLPEKAKEMKDALQLFRAQNLEPIDAVKR